VGKVSATAQQAIGFREILALLEGRIDEAECRARITTQTQQYAKRQMTWFRRDSDWQVLQMGQEESPTEAARRVAELLSFNR
jgi:tRNA dimethylallyltransferase